MICRFRKNLPEKRFIRQGFTILEVVAALTILAMICATTLVVLNRCMQSTIDSELKMQAFKVARENMEKLLANKTVTQTVEFGTLEENPNIDWQMLVEPFREPATSKMWIRAVCTASYTDSKGEMQNFELENWITDLTDAQVKKLLDQQKREKEFIEATGENPFGDDTDGLLKWMKHLMDTGDVDAARDVAEEIKEIDPEILPEEYDPEDHIDDSQGEGDTGEDGEGDADQPDEPKTRQQRMNEMIPIWIAEGKSLGEIMQLLFTIE